MVPPAPNNRGSVTALSFSFLQRSIRWLGTRIQLYNRQNRLNLTAHWLAPPNKDCDGNDLVSHTHACINTITRYTCSLHTFRHCKVTHPVNNRHSLHLCRVRQSTNGFPHGGIRFQERSSKAQFFPWSLRLTTRETHTASQRKLVFRMFLVNLHNITLWYLDEKCT